jgi:REP element-mobilizing transposase RayT
LRGHDYAQTGMYYVTVCVKDRECILGENLQNEVKLSRIGKIVKECWEGIPKHFSHAMLDEFVIMPDHLHGIIILVGTRHAVSQPLASSQREEISLQTGEEFGRPICGSLSTIMRSFKSAASNRIHSEGYPEFAWQSRFYDHILRDARDLERVRRYIRNNPTRWFDNCRKEIECA